MKIFLFGCRKNEKVKQGIADHELFKYKNYSLFKFLFSHLHLAKTFGIFNYIETELMIK